MLSTLFRQTGRDYCSSRKEVDKESREPDYDEDKDSARRKAKRVGRDWNQLQMNDLIPNQK